MSDSLGDFPRESRKGVAVFFPSGALSECIWSTGTVQTLLLQSFRGLVPESGRRTVLQEGCPAGTWFPRIVLGSWNPPGSLGSPPPLTGFPNNGVPQELPIGIPTNCNLHAIFQLDADFFPEFLLSRIRHIQNVLLIERNSVVLLLGCLGSS